MQAKQCEIERYIGNTLEVGVIFYDQTIQPLDMFTTYCWWFRNPACSTWDVFSNPANSGKFTISTGAGLFPSRVWAAKRLAGFHPSRVPLVLVYMSWFSLFCWLGWPSPLTLKMTLAKAKLAWKVRFDKFDSYGRIRWFLTMLIMCSLQTWCVCFLDVMIVLCLPCLRVFVQANMIMKHKKIIATLGIFNGIFWDLCVCLFLEKPGKGTLPRACYVCLADLWIFFVARKRWPSKSRPGWTETRFSATGWVGGMKPPGVHFFRTKKVVNSCWWTKHPAVTSWYGKISHTLQGFIQAVQDFFHQQHVWLRGGFSKMLFDFCLPLYLLGETKGKRFLIWWRACFIQRGRNHQLVIFPRMTKSTYPDSVHYNI